jgi:hypothetical protein
MKRLNDFAKIGSVADVKKNLKGLVKKKKGRKSFDDVPWVNPPASIGSHHGEFVSCPNKRAYGR